MAWVRLDDGFADHPKVAEAGPLGMALQVAALCYCNKYETDGRVPRNIAVRLVYFEGLAHPEDVIKRLVDCGMWIEEDGGYRIHDYHDFQPSKSQLDELREKRREAGRKGGQANGKQSAKQTDEQDESIDESKTDSKIEPRSRTRSHTQDKEHNSSRPTLWPEESLPYRLAARLRSAILERDPGTKVPDLDSKTFAGWCVEADRMIRLDERDPDEALSLIDWCQQDAFWSANILSMPTFRKQYDKLKRKANTPTRASPTRERPVSAATAYLRQRGMM